VNWQAPIPRRAVLAGIAAAALVPARPDIAAATPGVNGPLAAALRALGIAPEAVRWGEGFTLTAPAIAEDGMAVPVTLRLAEAPAAPVQAIHLFAPANRRALVASFTPGEAAGRTETSLRIRLAKTQTVAAVARRADGSVTGASAEIQVTAGGGCRT